MELAMIVPKGGRVVLSSPDHSGDHFNQRRTGSL
jgi:hypothetical protein